MIVRDEFGSVGKAARLRMADAPIGWPRRERRESADHAHRGYGGLRKFDRPATGARTIGQWTAKGNHMSGDLRVAVEAAQNARRAAGSGMKGVAEEMADKLDASVEAYDGMAGSHLGDRMQTR
jgi:excreted virulence factor EspC (type VII ESX diderm)